jgi:hypothetical protein
MTRVVVVVVLCAVAAASRADTIRSEHTTVCAIAADPDRFEGRIVTIDAVVSVGYHFSLLKDDECPRVGIQLGWAEPAASRRDIRQMKDVLFETAPSRDNDRAISATFTGRFYTYFDGVSFRALDLLAVSNLKRLYR